MVSELKERPKADEIDMLDIVAIFWKRRGLIVLGTLAATLLAAGTVHFMPKTYRSEGFYQLGNPELQKAIKRGGADRIGFPLRLYQRFSRHLFDPNRFQVEARRENFQASGDISQWVKPEFAYTWENMQEAAKVGRKSINSVIGLNLRFEAGSPRDAQKHVEFFGNYIRDGLFYLTLHDYVTKNHFFSQTRLNSIENDLIKNQFESMQNLRKKMDIEAIRSKYPESARIAHCLSDSGREQGEEIPSLQDSLFDLECTLAELRRVRPWLEREKEIALLHLEYFSRCRNELKSMNRDVVTLFSRLEALHSTMLLDMDLSKDTVRWVANRLQIDLQAFRHAFFTDCYFLSGPTLPGAHIRPREGMTVFIAFFLSAFFFLFLAIFLHWWRENRPAFVSHAAKR